MSYTTTGGYKLEYLGKVTGNDATSHSVDITSYVESIGKFTECGNGEIPSARVTLRAPRGEFMTLTNAAAPPIKQWDLLRITVEDRKRKKVSMVMVADDIQPQENASGRRIILEMLGRERYLQKIYVTGKYSFVRFRTALQNIRDSYSSSTPQFLQPDLAFWSSDLEKIPNHAWGSFDWGGRTTVYDAIQEVMRRLSLPTAAGGGGQIWSAIYDREHSTLHGIVLRVVARGDVATKKLSRTMNLTRTRSPETGTISVAMGAPASGTFPEDGAVVRGLIEEYENIPEYDPSVAYLKGAYVRWQGRVWQAKKNITASTNPIGAITASTDNWLLTTFASYEQNYLLWKDGAGPHSVIDYSPWTKGRADAIRTWCGSPGGTPGSGGIGSAPCFPDSNLVIREETASTGSNSITVWRDWADFRITSSSDSTTTTRFGSPYNGMRVLLVGDSLPSAFTGANARDQFGKKYANSIAQYWKGKWIVIRELSQHDQCAIFNEGKVYEYNAPLTTSGTPPRAKRPASVFTSTPAGGYGVRDTSQVLLGNDCFHYPQSIRNVKGLVSSEGSGGVLPDTRTENSAIEIKYTYAENDAARQLADLVVPVLDLAASIYRTVGGLFGLAIDGDDVTDDVKRRAYNDDVYNNGWWYTLFEAPFPRTTDRGQRVGSIHTRHALDYLNMTQTPSGYNGYDKSDSSELGRLDGISFLFRFNIEGITLDSIYGDVPFRCVMYDLFGGVWRSDFLVRYQNETQQIRLPFSSFSQHRSRIPLAYTLQNWIHRVQNPELRNSDAPNLRHVKRIVIHLMHTYDEQGRYDPYKWDKLLWTVIAAFTGANITYTGTVDAVHFTKTPIAIASRPNTIHVMGPPKEHHDITNQIQLQKIARANLDIDGHQPDTVEFQVSDRSPTGACVLNAEDTVRLTNEAFITESESESYTDDEGDTQTRTLTNTRDYIVDRVTYSVGESGTGGGLVATILASRKIGDP